MIGEALEYAKLGYSIIPVDSNKRPLEKWLERVPGAQGRPKREIQGQPGHEH